MNANQRMTTNVQEREFLVFIRILVLLDFSGDNFFRYIPRYFFVIGKFHAV